MAENQATPDGDGDIDDCVLDTSGIKRDFSSETSQGSVVCSLRINLKTRVRMRMSANRPRIPATVAVIDERKRYLSTIDGLFGNSREETDPVSLVGRIAGINTCNDQECFHKLGLRARNLLKQECI